MKKLDKQREEQLIKFALALVDQQKARVIIPPQESNQGFWFGGGNMIEDDEGNLFVVGRYRNGGDSRTGLKAGERGCELSFFCSCDRGETFEKIVHFKKADLNVGDKEVLSIEGAAIQFIENGVELFVSTEKDHVGYPAEVKSHLKPGTGVWSIEKLTAGSIQELAESSVKTVLKTDDPQFVHIKDPFLYRNNERSYLLFCSHPYSWTSSNTGYSVYHDGQFEEPVYDFFHRGFTWDVAMTRGTCIIDVPQLGDFQDLSVSLIFYDGGECVRNLDEHQDAVSRPRGYSCEELGGVGYMIDGQISQIQRLSVNQPLFVSPYGTGCSRYVDVLKTTEGFYSTWQQSQEDCSQPLVMNFLSNESALMILS